MAGELIERAEVLFQTGQAQQAMDLLGTAARNNDPDALEYLGRMSVVGTIVHRDLRLARDLFGRAAAAGSKAGAVAYRAFLASGTGGPSDWGQAVDLLAQVPRNEPDVQQELTLINSMSLTDDGEPKVKPEGQQLSESPEVWTFPGIFSEAECDFLIDVAMPQLAPSLVVDPQTGQLIANPVRTSDAAGFPLMAESPAIHALCRRLAAASGTRVNQGEPLQILRYRPGQQYRPHFDAIEGADNQRILTFLVYLNDDYRGGETRFESTGLEFKGRKGDGVLFRNASADGRPDLRSQHAGLPVLGGEKFLASRWIRERPLIPG